MLHTVLMTMLDDAALCAAGDATLIPGPKHPHLGRASREPETSSCGKTPTYWKGIPGTWVVALHRVRIVKVVCNLGWGSGPCGHDLGRTGGGRPPAMPRSHRNQSEIKATSRRPPPYGFHNRSGPRIYDFRITHPYINSWSIGVPCNDPPFLSTWRDHGFFRLPRILWLLVLSGLKIQPNTQPGRHTVRKTEDGNIIRVLHQTDPVVNTSCCMSSIEQPC